MDLDLLSTFEAVARTASFSAAARELRHPQVLGQPRRWPGWRPSSACRSSSAPPARSRSARPAPPSTTGSPRSSPPSERPLRDAGAGGAPLRAAAGHRAGRPGRALPGGGGDPLHRPLPGGLGGPPPDRAGGRPGGARGSTWRCGWRPRCRTPRWWSGGPRRSSSRPTPRRSTWPAAARRAPRRSWRGTTGSSSAAGRSGSRWPRRRRARPGSARGRIGCDDLLFVRDALRAGAGARAPPDLRGRAGRAGRRAASGCCLGWSGRPATSTSSARPRASRRAR